MLERNAPVQISRKFRTSNAARNAGRRPGRASTVAEAGSSEVRADYFLVFFAEAAIAAILRAFKTSSRRFRRRLISCCRSIIESVCLQKNGCAWREAAILPWMPGSGRPACSPRRKSAGIRARSLAPGHERCIPPGLLRSGARIFPIFGPFGSSPAGRIARLGAGAQPALGARRTVTADC